MVVVSMLPHAEIGGNDHREDAPQFTLLLAAIKTQEACVRNRGDFFGLRIRCVRDGSRKFESKVPPKHSV